MTEKEKLLETLVEKSGKSQEELQKLVNEKVNELSGLVSEEGALYIIANELKIALETNQPKKKAENVKITSITEPKQPTSLLCKVLRKYDKVTFTSSSGGEGSVQSLLVGDDTGIIRIVFWNDKTDLLEQVHDGDVLRISNGYSRENNNSQRIEIHYGPYSDMEVNPEGEDVEVVEYKPSIEFSDIKVSELQGDEKNVKLKATITDFDIPRYYLGCPECFKKVFQDEEIYRCAVHGEVEPIKIPIVNLVIDDGTGTLNVVAFRDRAEQLTGLSSEEIIGLTEDIDKYREFKDSLIEKTIEVGGNASISSMTEEVQLIINQLIDMEKSEEPLKKPETKQKETTEEVEEDLDIEEISIDDDDL